MRKNRFFWLFLLAAAPGAAETPPLALTEGVFRVHYTLSQKGRVVESRGVNVQVLNRTRLPMNPAEPLVFHESVHRRINALGGDKLEKILGDFRVECREGPAGLREARARFLKDFRRQIQEINRLQRDWDATNVPRQAF